VIENHDIISKKFD